MAVVVVVAVAVIVVVVVVVIVVALICNKFEIDMRLRSGMEKLTMAGCTRRVMKTMLVGQSRNGLFCRGMHCANRRIIIIIIMIMLSYVRVTIIMKRYSGVDSTLKYALSLRCSDYFARVILCNSLVWTCSLTGKSGLTFQDAQESEEAGREMVRAFPRALRKPVLFITNLTSRGRFADLLDDVFNFVKDHFFVGEELDYMVNGRR